MSSGDFNGESTSDFPTTKSYFRKQIPKSPVRDFPLKHYTVTLSLDYSWIQAPAPSGASVGVQGSSLMFLCLGLLSNKPLMITVEPNPMGSLWGLNDNNSSVWKVVNVLHDLLRLIIKTSLKSISFYFQQTRVNTLISSSPLTFHNGLYQYFQRIQPEQWDF